MDLQQLIDGPSVLAGPHGRLPGTSQHAEAAQYIETRLQELGLHPRHGGTYRLPYTAAINPDGRRVPGGFPMRNLAAVIRGRERTLAPIVIGAHYESVIPAPSADDNATSVAAMPAAAALLMAVRNDRVGDMSDHHASRLQGHPFLFLSSGEWADHHSPRETPDKIDYGKIAGIAALVAEVAAAMDAMELGPALDSDIWGLEMATAVEHLGRDTVEMLGGDPDTIV